jgi:5-oxoprolinase (ATP-hydrolysing) subunit C
VLIAERVGPLVTVQDAGRFGYARYGVPAAGPWDLATWKRTVDAVGTDVAIEIPLMGARFVIEEDVAVSIDGEVVRGPVIEVARHERAVRYLAVAAGLDVPVVMGSRAGVVLRSGDRVGLRFEPLADARGCSGAEERLVIVPTFDSPAHVLEAFLAATLTIDPRSDRVGTRLVGSIPAPTPGLSRPIVPGAVQVPPDGAPIVIGPDGPTTGGYPVIGVLPRSSRDALARLRPGSEVRFGLA